MELCDLHAAWFRSLGFLPLLQALSASSGVFEGSLFDQQPVLGAYKLEIKVWAAPSLVPAKWLLWAFFEPLWKAQ